jgi:23S rRNA (guanosine2251-2'-O)-methyltransferase
MREWISGRNPVFEVLSAGRRHFFRLRIAQGVQETGRVQEIISLCGMRNLSVERVSRSQLDALAPGNQGIALETSEYPYSNLPDVLDLAAARGESPLILILDTLQDPQNLGTLLRTAEVTGVHGVLLPFRRTATVTPAVVHASSGASEHLLVAQVNLAQAIAILKAAGVWVIGLESRSEALPPEQVRLDGALALVVGSEAEGMRSLVRLSCDLLMCLPMRGNVASLNAAVAGSIALYLAWQARGFPGRQDR